MEDIVAGALYLVATPIGNLADITYRAVHILKNVNFIAAEDTRKSGILLQHYEIKTPVRSYHSYNLKKETPHLIRLLQSEKSVAVISDAGTPGISDPGYQLVVAAREANIRIIPIPGASALLAAVVTSGLKINRFVYEGFLPQKKGRKTRLERLSSEERTIVIYESPHRILKTVKEIRNVFGERACVMARELTKKFEEIYTGNLGELASELEQRTIKGEIVLMIEGYDKRKVSEDNVH